jgi:hypothetical protein
MPVAANEETGYQLHPVDLAINKLLALAGRDEPRDFLDILYVHKTILPLGALCWAAVGKDPGFTPFSLLELIKRRGRYRPEDFAHLMLTDPIDLVALKTTWLQMLAEAEAFMHSRPSHELGCLYYSAAEGKFIAPVADVAGTLPAAVPHYGRPGGVLPRIDAA